MPPERLRREYRRAVHQAWFVDLEPPDNMVLGHELLAEIGVGAFGRVFRARRGDTGEEVALKLLHETILQKPEMLESFRRGVRSMRILSENGVQGMVPYVDASEIPAFAVMDLVRGPDLKNAVDSGFLIDW
jgi:eukaryotic-like serine/threonine-protein kinase